MKIASIWGDNDTGLQRAERKHRIAQDARSFSTACKMPTETGEIWLHGALFILTGQDKTRRSDTRAGVLFCWLLADRC